MDCVSGKFNTGLDIGKCVRCKKQRTMRLPLSANTFHASMEALSDVSAIPYERFMLVPRGAIPSTGLIGTLHNNQVIDMCPW